MRRLNPILLTAFLALSGCVHYAWVKPGGDPSTFGVDNYACLQSANYQAPPLYQTYDANPYGKDTSQESTVCTKQGSTTTCQKSTVNKQKYFGQPMVNDLNEYNRNQLYNACMGSKGWVYQAFEDKD